MLWLPSAHAEGRLGVVLAPSEIPAGEEFSVYISASALERGIDRAIALQYSDQLTFLGAYAVDEDGLDTVSLTPDHSVASMFEREKGHVVVAFEDRTTIYSDNYRAIVYVFRFRGPAKSHTASVSACLIERANATTLRQMNDPPKGRQKKRKHVSASSTWRIVAPNLGDDFAFADIDTKEYEKAIKILAGWDKTSRALRLSARHSAVARLVTDSSLLRSIFQKDFVLSCWVRCTLPMQTFFRWQSSRDDESPWLGTDALGDLIFSAHSGRSPDDTTVSSVASVSDGAWHHIAMSKDLFGKVIIQIDGQEADTSTSLVNFEGVVGFTIGSDSTSAEFSIDELSFQNTSQLTQPICVSTRDTVAGLFGLFHFEDFGDIARSSVSLRKKIRVNDTLETSIRIPIYFALDSGASIEPSASPILTDDAVLSVEQSTATRVTFAWYATSERGVRRYELQRRIASFGDYERTLVVKAKQPVRNVEEPHPIVARAMYSAIETLPSIGRDIELSYRLALIGDHDSVLAYTQPVKLEFGGNREVFVEQNKPNPFNPKTTIGFRLVRKTRVTVTVYDIMGREVGVLLDETLPVGKHSLEVDATLWPGGIYFYKVKTPRTIVTKRMVVAK